MGIYIYIYNWGIYNGTELDINNNRQTLKLIRPISKCAGPNISKHPVSFIFIPFSLVTSYLEKHSALACNKNILVHSTIGDFCFPQVDG